MEKIILFNTRDELIRVKQNQVMYIASDGNYSSMHLTTHENFVISFNLATIERIIKDQLGNQRSSLIRVGKCLIINVDYLFQIHLGKQKLILFDGQVGAYTALNASLKALKVLKQEVMENKYSLDKSESDI